VNSTFFVATPSGLASQVVNGNLRSVVGNNGVFGVLGQFPAGSYQNSNYFRDIVFVGGTTYNISGTISPAPNGGGATVTLSGAAGATTTADGSGNFSFAGLSNGSYTVAPSKNGFTFSPSSAPVSVNNANVTGPSFTATTTNTYGLSVSTSLDRSGAVALEGAAVEGNVYIFTGPAANRQDFTPAGISGLCYWLDNVSATGPATHCEAAVPYDFAGSAGGGPGSPANPWDVSGLPLGSHTITQVVTLSAGGTEIETVSFYIGSVQHYEYAVLYNDGMYVYDIDNDFQLVKHVNIPTPGEVQGVAAALSTRMLYISSGGNGGIAGTGSLIKFDLMTDTVVWTKAYPFGVDSFAVTPDGSTIYMPSGDASADGFWHVIDAVTGDVTGSINTGMLGPHNTVVSLDDQHIFFGPLQSSYLVDFSRSTNTVIRNIGPLNQGVRPFAINGKNTLAFTTGSFYFGFQVSNITTGTVLYTVPIPGFSIPPGYDAQPNHGISLSPDEKEIYLIDTANSYVHAFDVSGLPGSAPTLLAHIPLTGTFTDSETPCPYSFCPQEGWLQHTRDGQYVIVGNSGEIIDTSTRQVVKTLPPLANSRKHLQIDWLNGLPIFTTTRYGLGYVTR
jgi:hypothetical protein